jgi:hypothetical protein
LKYPNLLTLAEIKRYQCISTATCEKLFLCRIVLNRIIEIA